MREPGSPRVSVIIATYNRRKLLKESIESVLNQSFQDFEIIVIDDGSTDNTSELIQEINSPKIRYYYQENSGRSHARNKALGLARGEFIAFNDSDDLYFPDKLEIQVKTMDHNPDVGMLYSTAKCIDEAGKETPSPYLYATSGDIYPHIAYYLPLTLLLPSIMLRRWVVERIGGFDEALDRFEDTDMWRRSAKVTSAIGSEKPLIAVRAHGGNSMENPELLIKRLDLYIDKIHREDGGSLSIWRKIRVSDLYQNYAFAVLKNPQYFDKAEAFLWKSVEYWPLRYDSQHLLSCLHRLQKKKIGRAWLREYFARSMLAIFCLIRPWRALAEVERCLSLNDPHLSSLRIRV